MTKTSSIFITGGTSGLGLDLAKNFRRRGFKVAICGRDLSKCHDEFPGDSSVFRYELDVTNSKACEDAIKDFADKCGGLDIVVANAGRALGGDKNRIPDFEVGKKVFETNVFGVMNTFSPALKIMLEQKQGQLVAVSSIAGGMGLPGTSSYCASKAAVTTFCESLAIDLQSHGIRTTTICPGFVDTPLTKPNKHPMPFLISSEKAAEKMAQAIIKKKVLYTFPWQMFVISTFLSKIPRFLFRFLLGSKGLNYAQEKDKA